MRGKLLFLAAALIFCVFAALLVQTAGIGAIGASTNNSTIPDFPDGDQSIDEIKPLVNCIMVGPTSQANTTPPNVILGFIGASEQDKFKITANENWYLDIDINAPGWLYIYEDFPVGENSQGRWVAYKWQLLQGGIWRLGPFAPGNNEPEGQHICRIWFYSDGQWAGENSNASQNLVYWTYSKGQPNEQPAEQILPPIAPVKEATFLDRLHSFITNPIALALGVLILIILVGFYISRRYTRWGRSQDKVSLNEAEPEFPSSVLSSAVNSAKIALPNGLEIHLSGNGRVIGRGDLARVLGLDELGLISRQHFKVKWEDEQFYIEELDSANGTRLNGADIRGKGLVSLNDDDVIEPADAIRLKFYVL